MKDYNVIYKVKDIGGNEQWKTEEPNFGQTLVGLLEVKKGKEQEVVDMLNVNEDLMRKIL